MNSSDILELGKLFDKDPESVAKIFRENTALKDELVNWGKEKMVGQKPSVDNFKALYRGFFNRELPKIHEIVAEEFINALKNRTGVMLQSWRGGGKSTFFTAWCPSVIGWNPVGSTLLMRVNTQKAQEMGRAIATLIQTSEGWRKYFPHVIQNERAGWSVDNGYNVLDTRITGVPGSPQFEENLSKWNMLCLADHLSEQTLLCVGIESGMGIGSHPTNGMWFDDLHDEGNTSSPAELRKVVELVKGNVIPSWESIGGSPTVGVFCTPWSKNPPDAYEVMLDTGILKLIVIPIFKVDSEGETVPSQTEEGLAIANDWVGKKVKLTWPELYPMPRVAGMMRKYGTRFGQACMCDVNASLPRNIHFTSFEYEKIKFNEWPVVVGVDPVAWVRGVSKGGGLSNFAASEFLITPYNNVVIAGGFLERIDALEGERRLAEIQRKYGSTFRNFSIEKNGAGAIFMGMSTRIKGAYISGHEVSEAGKGDKKTRQHGLLATLFQCGAIAVSNENTPYLNLVREYLDSFPNFEAGSKFEDLGDSLVMAVLDIPQLWTRINVSDLTIERGNIFGRKKAEVSPWTSLGSWKR